MNTIYHGGQSIKEEAKSPLFLYDDISSSIYFASGYSGVEEKHISQFQLNQNAKVLDLVNGDKHENEKTIDSIMKKAGLVFDTYSLLVNNSEEKVGREVYGYDIDLVLFPKFRKELLSAGYNVLKNHTVLENTQPIGYAVLDSSVIDFKREYSLDKNENNEVILKVVKEKISQEEESILGKNYTGETGYGDIILEEVKSKNQKKM